MRRSAAGGGAAAVALVAAIVGGSAIAAGHLRAVTAERDRALAAEREAALQYADALVALARVDTDLDRVESAEARLREAAETYAARGADPKRADLARAWLAHRHPPPVLRIEEKARVEIAPGGDRVAWIDDRGIARLHAMPSGAPIGEAAVGGATTVVFDGDRAVAVVASGGVAQAVDLQTGAVICALPAFGPLSSFYAASGRLWIADPEAGAQAIDLASGEVAARLPEASVVLGVAASGDRLIGFEVEGSLRRQPEALTLWDRQGRSIARFDGTTQATISPDGRSVAWVGGGSVRLGGARSRWERADPSASVVRFAGDDRLVVSGRTGEVAWLDASDGALISRARLPGLLRAVTADGDRVLTRLSDRHEVRFRPDRTGPRAIDRAGITGAAITPDGELLATVGWSGRLLLSDWRTGRQLVDLEVSSAGVRSVDVSADGRYVATADRDGEVRLWDLVQGTDRALPRPQGDLGIAMAARFDGDRIVAAYEQGWIVEWTRDLALFTRHKIDLNPWDLRLAPGSDRLIVTGRGDLDPEWVVIDRRTGRWLHRSADQRAAYGAALSDDGRRAIVGTHGKRTLWVDLQTGAEIAHDTGAETLGVATDGAYVAAVTLDGDLALWDAIDGRDLGVFAVQPQGYLVAVAFAGGAILAFDSDGAMHSFDPALPRRLAAATPTLGGAAPPPLVRPSDLGWLLGYAGDASGAAAALQRAAAAGEAVHALDRVRQLAAAGRNDEALALLAEAPEASAGTLAVWRAALASASDRTPP